jgi:hypothetical protein
MELLGEDEEESYHSDYGNKSDTAHNIITAETINHLQNIWKDYKDIFSDFMNLLKDEELASKLRFLTFRLDFNEYYTNNPKNLKMKSIEEFKKKPPFPGAGGSDSFFPMTSEENPRIGRPGIQSSLKSRNDDRIIPEEYKTREFNDSFQDNIEEDTKIQEEARPPSRTSLTSSNTLFSKGTGLTGVSGIGGFTRDNSDLASIKDNIQRLLKMPVSRGTDNSYQIPRDISSIKGGYTTHDDDDREDYE